MRNLFLVVFVVFFVVLTVLVQPIFILGAIGYILIDYADRGMAKDVRRSREQELHQRMIAQHETTSRQFSIRDDIHSEYRPKNVGIELSELLKNPIYRVMNDHRHQMTAETICQKAVAEYHLSMVEARDLFIRLSDDNGVVKRRLSRKGKWLFWLVD